MSLSVIKIYHPLLQTVFRFAHQTRKAFFANFVNRKSLVARWSLPMPAITGSNRDHQLLIGDHFTTFTVTDEKKENEADDKCLC